MMGLNYFYLGDYVRSIAIFEQLAPDLGRTDEPRRRLVAERRLARSDCCMAACISNWIR